MNCLLCASSNQTEFSTEMAIHFAGLGKPHVFILPRILVCLDCGLSRFELPEAELQELREGRVSSAAA
jgi:hypothetical protein